MRHRSNGRQPPAFGLDPALKRLTWVGAGLALVYAAVGFVPLFGGPGYEAALALGLLLPMPVALVAAWLAERRLCADTPHWPGAQLMLEPVGFALLAFASCTLVCLAHGLRVGLCDPVQGALYLLLGPGVGALCAAGWGVLVACVRAAMPKPKQKRHWGWLFALAAAGPVCSVLTSLWRFWSSPMIFAFDPFFGYFAGTPYDTVIEVTERLMSYRLGSLAQAVALGFGLQALAARVEQRGRLRAGILWALAGVGLVATTVHHAHGPSLGHYQTPATLAEALKGRAQGERCDVVYDLAVSEERARRMAQECAAHLGQIERSLDFHFESRVTVYVFGSARQKGWLMGAANTYVAKPWRREVYLQNRAFPHPVLGHELAHAALGQLSSGPWGVPGPLAGLLPDPGRIEGFAVALSPREDADFTLLEWARALQELGTLPPLARLFRLSFLGENASKAYTIAGAFVTFLKESYGTEFLKYWYSGATLTSLPPGLSLAKLEREFHTRLASVELRGDVLALAQGRFGRPAVFGRRCPHVVDRVLGEAQTALMNGALEVARDGFQHAKSLDASSWGAHLGLARCAARAGEAVAERAAYEELLAAPWVGAARRAAVHERLGDSHLLSGDATAAMDAYLVAGEGGGNEHSYRRLDVKAWAARTNGVAREAIVRLLVGDERRKTDPLLSGAKLGAWAVQQPDQGMPHYLLGKNLAARGLYPEAAAALQQALLRGPMVPRVQREAHRALIVVYCAVGDRSSALAVASSYLADSALVPARRFEIERLLERCEPGSAAPAL